MFFFFVLNSPAGLVVLTPFFFSNAKFLITFVINLFLPVILTNNFKKLFCCFSMPYLVWRFTETVPSFVTAHKFCAPR